MEIIIGRYLESGILHSKLETSFGKEQTQNIIGPLHHLEKTFFGACLFANEVLQVEKTIKSYEKTKNDWFDRRDNPDYLKLLVYKDAFFVFCGMAYRELRELIKFVGNNVIKLEEVMKKIEPLKDLRDGVEHSAEDYYELLRGKWGQGNREMSLKKAENQLRKGALPKMTGKIKYYVDFENNLKLIEDAYNLFISFIFSNNTESEVKAK